MYKISLTGKNKTEALQLLKDVASVLHSCKLDYWLEGGTLLGIIRENRLLPWDNDVDISMMVPKKKQLNNLIVTLKKSGFRIRVRTIQKNTKPLIKNNVRIIKVRNKHFFGLLKGNVCLEIFIKYNIEGNAYWQVGEKVKNVPFKFYDTLKTVKFNDYNFLIPEKAIEYLTYRYGDWQTPKKEWDTFKDDNALK
ncbi:LicD family protein [Polaribacter sp. MSW13]|uniref:LicD family protein n=1 Tax=Polaribacter marinus TaxID=2916838 RepID=A0A9X2AK42_9FLAO|nr:LicD family protein [Polaribacter marinus]MCI2227775.1 LicD family protein [Polaribacter marinus]